MKKVFYLFDDAIRGEAFFDEEGNLIQYNHENDNNFRPEYMKTVFEYLGGEIVELMTELREIDEDDDPEDVIKANAARIKKAIKKANQRKEE